MTDTFEAVRRGLEALLAERRRLADAGVRPVGWKAAFGSPQAKQRLGLPHLLVGFLTDHTVVPPATTVSVGNWHRPVAEPEVAVRLGAEVVAGSPTEAVAAAVAELAPAVELADVDRAPEDDLEAVLAGNIFHRRAVVGELRPVRFPGSLAGWRGRVFRNGREFAVAEDLEEIPGRLVDVLAEMARVLAGVGEQLQAGDLVICGSVVAPVALEPGDRSLEFELVGIGRVSALVQWAGG
ncbi:2-keto-4-pentenoate hydratase [bacterium HR31]|nr:2-keto-4-pentenoate hydratase [bacterium HR31]